MRAADGGMREVKVQLSAKVKRSDREAKGGKPGVKARRTVGAGGVGGRGRQAQARRKGREAISARAGEREGEA